MKSIIIDGQKFNIADYSSLESLADIEFEDKDLSKIEVEDLEGIPDRLYYETSIPCTLEEALDSIAGLGTVFDWVNYVENNFSFSKERATIAYIDTFWGWDFSDFEDRYEGFYFSEEDFAEEYLASTGYNTNYLIDYFDYEAYGEVLYNDSNLEEYTPSALDDYRRELGLPLLKEDEEDNSMTRKELERRYGFIGDDEVDEEGDTFDDIIDLTKAQDEYDRFEEDHSWEIYLAEQYSEGGYKAIAEATINEIWDGIDNFLEETGYRREFMDMESFAQGLFNGEYTYIDGYVFLDN